IEISLGISEGTIRVHDSRLHGEVQTSSSGWIETADCRRVLVVAPVTLRIKDDAASRLRDAEARLRCKGGPMDHWCFPLRQVQRGHGEVLDQGVGRQPRQRLGMRGQLDDQLAYERVGLGEWRQCDLL